MSTRFLSCLIALLLITSHVQASKLDPAVETIRLQLREGKLEQAVKSSEKITSQRPTDPLAWYWAGNAFSRQAIAASLLGKPKWAGRTRTAWEKSIELDPGLMDARFNLIQFYLVAPGIMGGGRDKAEAQATEIGRRNASLGKTAEGVLAQYDKDRERGEAAFRQALALDPDNRRARSALSGLLQVGERWEELYALWKDRLAADPGDAFARYQLGRFAAIRGEHLEDGLGHLDRFIENGVVPDDLSIAAAHWRRGQILEKLERPDEARRAYELAIIDPDVRTQAQPDLDRLRKARG